MSFYNLFGNIKSDIDRYVEHGFEPGSFLMAVLCNNLFMAVGAADSINQKQIPEICRYIYNETPSACWGSPERVDDWIKMTAAERATSLEQQF